MPEPEAPLWVRTAHFVNRENGVMSRVQKVDTTYAYIAVLSATPSSWAMPVQQYDATWARTHVPIDMGRTEVPEKYRPPADVSVWEDPSLLVKDINPERGETTEGVVIG